jgi:hypothetical protein
MKKTLLPLCLLAVFALGACTSKGARSGTSSDPIGSEVTSDDTSTSSSSSSSSEGPITSLDAPTNVQVTNGVLTFSAVENAIDYVVKVTQGETVFYQKSTVALTVDFNNLGLYGGHYVVSVVARNGSIESEPASAEFKMLHVDTDARLEAELALLDRDRNWSDDEQASNGAYGLAFDDCGQGMYFRYYAFEAGNRDVTVTYSTGMAGSYMTLFANGQSFKVTYSENTGWFGDGHKTADVKIADVPMVAGWNELYLIKNGTNSDNPQWGGYAQVDYITIEGTNKSFDLDEFDMFSHSYKMEAEMAHWHWENSSQRPVNWGGNFSLGFGLGEMNAPGDGCSFMIDVKEAGTYAIRPCIGGNGDGSKTLSVSIDYGEEVVKSFGAISAWNAPVLADDDVYRVELTAGLHNIDLIRNGNWFTLDYLLLERI